MNILTVIAFACAIFMAGFCQYTAMKYGVPWKEALGYGGGWAVAAVLFATRIF